MGEWLCPGGTADRSQARSARVVMQSAPVPEGRLKSWSVRAEIRSIVPLGRGYFGHDSRHFVPGYDHAVPPGQIHSRRIPLLQPASLKKPKDLSAMRARTFRILDKRPSERLHSESHF
jgi:hypothetical protein